MVPAGSMIPGCCHHNGQLGRLGKGCKVMSHTSRLFSKAWLLDFEWGYDPSSGAGLKTLNTTSPSHDFLVRICSECTTGRHTSINL